MIVDPHCENWSKVEVPSSISSPYYRSHQQKDEGREGRTDLGPVGVALDVRIEVVGECDPATLHLGRRFRRVHTKDIEQITRVEGLSPSAPAKDRGEGTYAKDRKVLVHAGDVAPNRHLFACHLEERPSTRLE